jgi:hypothetical protein
MSFGTLDYAGWSVQPAAEKEPAPAISTTVEKLWKTHPQGYLVAALSFWVNP